MHSARVILGLMLLSFAGRSKPSTYVPNLPSGVVFTGSTGSSPAEVAASVFPSHPTGIHVTCTLRLLVHAGSAPLHRSTFPSFRQLAMFRRRRLLPLMSHSDNCLLEFPFRDWWAFCAGSASASAGFHSRSCDRRHRGGLVHAGSVTLRRLC